MTKMDLQQSIPGCFAPSIRLCSDGVGGKCGALCRGALVGLACKCAATHYSGLHHQPNSKGIRQSGPSAAKVAARPDA